MSKILFITVCLLVFTNAMADMQPVKTADFDLESLPFVTVGEENDFQIFGISLRGIIFYLAKLGVKGYIAGYEGRYDIPRECLDGYATNLKISKFNNQNTLSFSYA